jgi:hypothetical protein
VQDLLFLLATIVFFALTWALVAFAGRLEEVEKGDGKP